MKPSSEMSCIARSRWSWQSSGIISLLLSVFLSLPLAAQSTPATITTPGPGSALTGTTVTFTWTAGAGLQRCQLYVGTTLRSNGIFGQIYTAPGTTSARVTGIPARGGVLYVTLYSQVADGSWRAMDYTHKESGTPQAIAIGTFNDSTTPVSVSYLGTAVNITGGTFNTCAALVDGSADCWGNNTSGQLGNGTVLAANIPMTVLTSNGGQGIPIKIGSNALKYSTGDSAIASASGSSGIVTGKGSGSTTVKVTLGSASATTSITVN